MYKYNNTTQKGRSAAEKRWAKYEEELKKLHNHDPLLKSRLCGYLAGDGCVIICKEKARPHLKNKRISFYPDHICLANDFRETFHKVYGVKPSLEKEKNHYRVRLGSKLAYLDLISLAKFDSLGWGIPSKILTTPETKKE